MPNTYRRSISSARKLSASRRASLIEGLDYDLLLERLSALDLDDLPEDSEGRHHPRYVDAILEVAAKASEEVGRSNVRAWAQNFLQRRPEFSRTKNGIGAMMLESWLAKEQGVLFRQFVETVLEKGDQFLAIFEGMVGREDRRRMRAATAHFCDMKPLVEAGQTDGEEVLEFTIFDCSAKISQKEPANYDARPDALTQDSTGSSGSVSAMESLVPTTPEAYAEIREEGGLSREALIAVMGESVFDRDIRTSTGGLIAVDRHGVEWLSEDDGASWLPQSTDALDEDDDEPGSFFEDEDDLDEDDGPPQTLVSDFGTWALVEDMEGTRVAAKGGLWHTDKDFGEVVEAVAEAGGLYADSPAEGDLFIERFLADFCEDHATYLGRTLDEADDEDRVERDALVEAVIGERLEEAATKEVPSIVSKWASEKGMPVAEAMRRYEKAGRLVSQQYPDVSEESDRWYQLKVGIFKSMMRKADETQLTERQKVDPHLAIPSEVGRQFRKGAFKVSGKALDAIAKETDFKLPSDSLFREVKSRINGIDRNDLPGLFGRANIPDAQDYLAHHPRKAYLDFLRNLHKIDAKLGRYVRSVPENAPLVFFAIMVGLSGEEMAKVVFRRYFRDVSDHPGQARRKKLAESGEWLPESIADLRFLIEKDDEEDEEDDEGSGKKP